MKGKINYFVGNDKSKWKANIPAFDSVSLGEAYKGIEIRLKTYGKKVEKIFTVQPGADPKVIKLKMEGAKSLKITGKGELEIETGLGAVKFSKPLAYQEKDGKRTPVQVAYFLVENTYGFEMGDYDNTYPLIIDPVLNYSTYLGGYETGEEIIEDIAVDSFGNVYVTGVTSASDFPVTSGAYDTTLSSTDGVVAKINPNLSGSSSLIYSTFLGGTNGATTLNAIAVDTSGNAYVTGWTTSTDFPTTSGAYDNTGPSSYSKVVMTKVNSTGTGLLYSTYLGGSLSDFGYGIAVDSSGNAYVTGDTSSTNFPTTSGAYDETFNLFGDVFVTKIDPLQSGANSLIYSTYLGGGWSDNAQDIAVDGSGNAYITGHTLSDADFPIVGAGALQDTFGGGTDAFVTQLDSVGATLIYSTFLGGAGYEYGGSSIAVDGDGSAYVTGFGRSDFLSRGCS